MSVEPHPLPGPPEETGIGLAAPLALMLPAWLSAIAFGLAPVLPEISREFADTPGAGTVARLLLPAVGAALVIGTPVATFLATRFGERAVLVVALILFALFGTSGMVIHDPWLLLISRVLTGMSMAAAGLAAITLLTFFVSEHGRNRWIGFYTLSGTAAAVVLLPLIGIIGAQNWRLVFLPHLLAVVMLIGVAIFVPAPPMRTPTGSTRTSGGKFSPMMLLTGLACGTIVSTFSNYVPFHLLSIGVTGPQRVSLVLFAGTLGSAAFAFAYGWIRSRLSAAETFALAFLLGSLGLIGVVLGESFAAAVIGLLLTGTGAGLLSANVFAVAATAAPEHRAGRIGIAKTGFYGAPLLAQIPLEAVMLQYGASSPLLALAAFAAVMAAGSLLLRRTLGADQN